MRLVNYSEIGGDVSERSEDVPTILPITLNFPNLK